LFICFLKGKKSSKGAHEENHEWRSARKPMGMGNAASHLLGSKLVNSKQETGLLGKKREKGSGSRVRRNV